MNITTEQYWDCECVDHYIHPKEDDKCWRCHAKREDQPDSMKVEVKIASKICDSNLWAIPEPLLKKGVNNV